MSQDTVDIPRALAVALLKAGSAYNDFVNQQEIIRRFIEAKWPSPLMPLDPRYAEDVERMRREAERLLLANRHAQEELMPLMRDWARSKVREELVED